MSWDSKVQNLLGHCVSESAFGSEITHLPKIGQAQAFNMIWSDVYLAVNPQDGVTVQSSDPNVGARLTDFKTQPQKGDRIKRRKDGEDRYYIVRAVEPDGEGGVTLVLEKDVCK